MEKTLGRGIGKMFGDSLLQESVGEAELGLIQQNPYQPRKNFDLDEIASLTASVKTHGILQPIVVRRTDGPHFQLVAGERRLRAAHDAGLKSVPIHIVDFNDQQAYEAALVENIQRSDLNPIEKALGFKDYLERFKLQHEQLAGRLGLARSTITNLINLLELAPEVQDGIRLNQITEAHAKVLKGVRSRERQVGVFKQIVAMGLSVKATEALLREQRDGPAEEPEETREAAESSNEFRTAHVQSIEDELRLRLATNVEIKVRAKDKGTIVIHFWTNDDFERILEVLRK